MRLIIWFFVLLAVCSLSLEAQNDFWIGNIHSLSLQKVNEHEISMRINLREYTAEGKFETFDENKVIVLNRDSAFKSWTLIFDNVAAGRYQDYHREFNNKEMLFISEVFIEQQQGSLANAKQLQTEAGTNIFTSKLHVVGYVPIFLSLERISKQDTSDVVLYYTITDRIPSEGEQVQNNRIELSVADFEKESAVGRYSSIAPDDPSPKLSKVLRKLEELPLGTFVTVIYRVKYADIEKLAEQVEIVLSGLGQIQINRDNAQIIIRDRSERVLEILKLLAELDQPIPQVLIDVQILERNINMGYEFAAQFDYLKDNGTLHGIGLGNRPNLGSRGSNISGVYSNLSNPLLKTFQAQINNEIQRGITRLKASTRVVCQSRRKAIFHSGNSIPYYQQSEIKLDEDLNQNFFREQFLDGQGGKTEREQENRLEEERKRRSWKVQFIKTGVNLEVEPIVQNSGLIELSLHPSYSEITDIETHTDIPVLSDRSLQTSISVASGDTILVGGFLKERKIQVEKGIPVLMDIPLLGGLFTSSYMDKRLTEIVFVLTIYRFSRR